MGKTTSSSQPLVDTGRSDEALQREFTGGSIPVAVYGLGKMGLPIAATFAERSGNVRGVDVDRAVVAAVTAGECPVSGEPGLATLVEECVTADALDATTDGQAVAADATIHVLIVPTLLGADHTPDLTHLLAAVETIGSGLSAGDAVFVESTVPPRTCRDVVRPRLEKESGLDLGEFGLAFCPERTASGRALADIQSSYPKVVGGATPESTRVARVIYDVITDNEVIPVQGTTTVECVKLFEGLYRDVNIALANELATFVDDVDVSHAIQLANTVPYCDLHTPGAGVGGHCIPYYPYFLSEPFETPAPLLERARAVNDEMPTFAVDRLRDLLERPSDLSGESIVVLGATYRPGVDEIRASPAHGVVDELGRLGANVSVVDPVCTSLEAFDAATLSLAEFQQTDPDGVVLVTAQTVFDEIDFDRFASMAVVDGRQALELSGTAHRVYTIGRGRTN